jgi:hypothetical protein
MYFPLPPAALSIPQSLAATVHFLTGADYLIQSEQLVQIFLVLVVLAMGCILLQYLMGDSHIH